MFVYVCLNVEQTHTSTCACFSVLEIKPSLSHTPFLRRGLTKLHGLDPNS